MIHKLQMKFVAINMSIVTIMLCVILGLIYHFTSANLEAESIAMMKTIGAQPFQRDLPSELKEDVRLPYFTVQLGVRGELKATGGGYYDLSDDVFINDLVEKTLDFPKEFGVIKEYNLRYYRVNTPYNKCLVFADISSEITTLNNLIRTSIFIGILSFFAFLIVSLLLSKWAVKPIAKAWEQQRQFIADASHELKTPLTVIMTNADLIQNAECDEESKHRYLDNIAVVSKQMKNLIEKMLELAKADTINQELVSYMFNFSKVIYDAVLPFETLFFERNLSLQTEIEEDIYIKGDESQIRQVAEILLDNAQKYSKEAGRVWVTLKKYKKGRCLLCVANEGVPLSKEDIHHIFKRFYRSDQARNRNGSYGLGLAIAEGIVEKHKGKIWADSSRGINCFYVELVVKSN